MTKIKSQNRKTKLLNTKSNKIMLLNNKNTMIIKKHYAEMPRHNNKSKTNLKVTIIHLTPTVAL